MAKTGLMAEADWHASLPGVVVSAAGLIGDGAGRVLVVKPSYRDHWSLPGGVCEFGEAPHRGCEREVSEEIGLPLPAGTLLCVDWQMPASIYGPRARPAVHFVFNCGVLESLAGIRLQADELDDCQFASRAALDSLLPAAMLPRVLAAMAALSSGCARYVPWPSAGTAPG